MDRPVTFAEILEAAEQLDPTAQAELIAILSCRLADRGREQVVASVAQARQEHADGRCRAMTPDEIIGEAVVDLPDPVGPISMRSPRLLRREDAEFFAKDRRENNFPKRVISSGSLDSSTGA